MRAVSDAGPLIHLSWIDQLRILDQLFDEVIVPEAVRDEVLAAPEGTLGRERIEQAFTDGWLRVVAPQRPWRLSRGVAEALDLGEIEALALAKETDADLLITDDLPARTEAERRGLDVAGTVGVLIEARNQSLTPAALPLILELRGLGQWIGDELVELVERHEGSTP